MRSPLRFPRPGASARLLLFLLLCLASLPARAAAPFVVDGAVPTTSLDRWLDWRCDPSGQLGLEDMRQLPFQDNLGRAVVLGFRPGSCWFHFRVENRSATPRHLMLQLAYPILDHVELYAPGSGTPTVVTGDLEPYARRPLPTRYFTFPVRLLPGQQQDYYVRVASSSSMNVPLALSDSVHYANDHEIHEWVTGIGFGILLGLLIYHSFLWLAVRESVFRFYVFYVSAGFCYMLCMNGIAYRLWPDAPDWNSHAQPFFVLLMLAAAPLFARDFLVGTTRLPRSADLALLAAGVVTGVLAWLQFALPLHLIYPLQAMASFPVIAAILASTLLQLRQSPGGLRIFLSSWLVLIASSLVLSLQSLGFFPHLPFLVSLQAMELTFILQQLMLALALANRLNTLKRERAQQHQAVLRAEAESAAKTEFLARMSHEIRTPLNALLGITELMSDTRLDEAQKHYLDTISDAGQALLHVINDILDYSKIAAGKVTLEDADFSLLELLDECIRIFSLKAREKSLALVCERSRDLPTFVRGDMARLRQVLLNLLSNAIKFTEHGNVHLRASLDGQQGDRLRLRFEVEDSGIGIPPDKVPLLFTSFTQADTSTAREYGGTGLGLAISKQLVELMGGSISVNSAPGQGSLFRVTVELRAGVAPQPHLPGGTVTTSPARDAFAGRRVLVVEDNPVNQMVILGFLHRLGVDASIASSGQQALDLLCQAGTPRFDIVFMDCEMPQMDGFEATRRLRAWEAAHGQPRQTVVALTAHALPEHRQQCLAAGMDDYLSKPLMLPRLAEKLQQVLAPLA